MDGLHRLVLCHSYSLPPPQESFPNQQKYGALDWSSAKAQPPGVEKSDFRVYRDQPGFTPPPSFGPLIDAGTDKEDDMWMERRSRSRTPSRSRRSFSIGKRLWSHGSQTSRGSSPSRPRSRRPQISAPSNFRHLHSESFQFPQLAQLPPARPRRPRSFRPLELSIYEPGNRISPIISYFDPGHASRDKATTPPPQAHAQGGFDSEGSTLAHQRSYSSMSFHLPRRPLPTNLSSSPSQSVDANPWNAPSPDNTPPRIPPRSRARAYTSPDVDRIVERIASAMIEKQKLQAEIDSIVERQSIYLGSRPSTAHGIQDLEPMPSIPAMPAAAPSFAERLSFERPQTAPPKSLAQNAHLDHFGKEYEASAFFGLPQLPVKTRQILGPADRPMERPFDPPLAPPLPLVLRPPLRKKKSFSRVSNWLFPGPEHHRDMSFDSVTNAPRPVKDKEGFYQCVDPTSNGGIERTSIDTVSSASSWETEEGDRTMTTTLSPTASPSTKHNTPSATPRLTRTTTFGQDATSSRYRPQSVGVAI